MSLIWFFNLNLFFGFLEGEYKTIKAEKPIFIAGSGAYYSGAEKEFTKFIEKTGAPGFTSAMGRGVIPDTHPLCFEASSAGQQGKLTSRLKILRPNVPVIFSILCRSK